MAFATWHPDSYLRALHGIRSLYSALLLCLFVLTLPGQAPEAARLSPDARRSSSENEEAALTAPNAKAASSLISGSPWPGIINCLLESPQDDDSDQIKIHINYPSLGNPHIDADIRHWVGEIANAFKTHLNMERLPKSASSNLTDFDSCVDNVLNGDLFSIEEEEREEETFELWGDYKISRPSAQAISITFELWNYAGSAQGNLDVITLNYSLLNNRRLNFVDIFENPDEALTLMSAYSRSALANRQGLTSNPKMLNDGTAPLTENFSSLTLTPSGVCINFQPWQVASSDAGVQKVEMPLEQLMPSAPLLALWGK